MGLRDLFVLKKKGGIVVATVIEKSPMEKIDIQIWCECGKLKIGGRNNIIPVIQPIRKHFDKELQLDSDNPPDIYTMEGVTGDQFFDYLMNGEPINVCTYTSSYYNNQALYRCLLSPLELFLMSNSGYVVVGDIGFAYNTTYTHAALEKIIFLTELCERGFFTNPEHIYTIDRVLWLMSNAGYDPNTYRQTKYDMSVDDNYRDNLMTRMKLNMYNHSTIRKYTNPLAGPNSQSIIDKEKTKKRIHSVHKKVKICDAHVHRGNENDENIVHVHTQHLDTYHNTELEKKFSKEELSYAKQCTNCLKVVFIGNNKMPGWGYNSPPVIEEKEWGEE